MKGRIAKETGAAPGREGAEAMPHGVFWLLATWSALGATATDSPICWTQDGRWYAYTVAVRAERSIPEPGWIFSGNIEPPTPAEEGGRLKFRLYASEPASGTTVLLDEGNAPLTAPVWSPDGAALAYGRSMEGPIGTLKFEVVVQDGLKRKRVLLTRPELGDVDPPALAKRTLAWSPDGRYLAVPASANSSELLVVRADTGMVLKTIAGGSCAGVVAGRFQAGVPSDRRANLVGALRCQFWIASQAGRSRHGAGGSFMDAGRPLDSGGVESRLLAHARPSPTLELVRIGIEDGRSERARRLDDRVEQPGARHSRPHLEH